MTTKLEVELLKHLGADPWGVVVNVEGPNAEGFYTARASMDLAEAEGEGRSRMPSKAVAYALQAAADALLGLIR